MSQPRQSNSSTQTHRSPAQIRAEGNGLRQARSLYLRQHAHNPIDWQPWGHAALERARRQDKPVFLSIGYAACHWCHVMEREVFEDDEVAAFMNEHFVSIKVDREERPDLDAVYMEAVQIMQGTGGWPMSVFLTPDQRPFFGGTYFPRDAFLLIAQRVLDVYRTRREDVHTQAAQVTAAIDEVQLSAPGPLDRTSIDAAARRAQAVFDSRWGGFSGRMKFPTPPRWAFLLHYYRKSGHEPLAQMVRATLDAMASGGLRDQLAGGFHRYSVDPIWLVPHFEKMLYDNAQLASLYTEAAVVLNPSYAAVAHHTIEFMLRDLRDSSPGFFASLDADSPDGEGAYYVWTARQLEDVAGARDGAMLARLFDVTEEGNFEGANVLTRRVPVEQVAEAFDTTADQVQATLDRWLPELLQARARRPAPGLDRKVITAWNGLAISALAQAATALDHARYRDAAHQCADYLWQTHRTGDGRLWRVSHDGEAEQSAVLDDYALLACGLLDLYEATFNAEYIRRAKALIDVVRDEFAAPDGGFFLTPRTTEAPLGRRFEVFDSVEPSGNAAAIQALLRLSALTGSEAYRSEAEGALRAQAVRMEQAGLEMAWWNDAALRLLGPFYQVVVAGDWNEPRTQELVQTARQLRAPHVVVIHVPAQGPDEQLATLLEPARGKTSAGQSPVAYVCQYGSCRAPTSDPAHLRAQLLEGWRH